MPSAPNALNARRQVDFGGGVGRDDDGPLDAIACTAPVAFDGAADGAVGAVDAV